MDNLEKQFIKVGNIQLHVVMAGPVDGEPIFLLHGFPEFWGGWKHQIPFLAEQGYRVIVPDQRGYNLSDKPKGVKNYKLDLLVQDIINLADALNYDKINLVGHDWGALVAWWVATKAPERLKKLVILNVPHPQVLLDNWKKGNLSQLLKSWYVGFFQIPFLPETMMSLGDFSVFEGMVRKTGNQHTFSEDYLDKLRAAWSQPNAMTSMINWYRAVKYSVMGEDFRTKKRITVPTLMLWGENDIALGKEMAQPSIELCDEGELIFYPNASHWLQHDEPDSVNEEILSFIRQPVTDPEA